MTSPAGQCASMPTSSATFATRLINSGLEQYVVQQSLTHASPRMTARYAQIHDHTVPTPSALLRSAGHTQASISDTT